MGRRLTDAALAGTIDPQGHPRLFSILEFTRKLTRDPRGLVVHDLAPLRESHLTNDAILDAVLVCAGFNVIVRVAGALGFDPGEPEQLRKGARFLLRFGYPLCSGVWLRMPRRHHWNKLERYRAAWHELERSVWESPGSLPPEIRRQAGCGQGIPAPLQGYTEKVVWNTSPVTGSDIVSLKHAGYSEDQIFEATVSAALRAGLIRIESGFSLLAGDFRAGPHPSSAAWY